MPGVIKAKKMAGSGEMLGARDDIAWKWRGDGMKVTAIKRNR